MSIKIRCQYGITAAVLAVAALVPAKPADAQRPPVTVDQGPNWTETTRNAFYIGDQGSQIMPLRWIEALKQPDGAPFMADSLSRYGYLPNDEKSARGLPVGFTAAGAKGSEQIGMTCAACHTRQIDVGGLPYRIDGGPSITDFQPFLADLDVAVHHVLNDDAAFKAFAQAVLGNASPSDIAKLHAEVAVWFLTYDALIKGALPANPWGPSRLDAVTMIFDRLTGLDIGPAPTYLIPSNIRVASAPVRYPFLWNAPKQDYTQWPGFAENGDNLLALARNLGEVYGVFADFHPQKVSGKIDYLKVNSANFPGLDALENLIKQLGAPKWPWALDAGLAAEGKAIYERHTADGGCTDCHGKVKGEDRPGNHDTWKTPILNVGTDTTEYQVLSSTIYTGVLTGQGLPALQPVDKAFSTLELAVGGSILQRLNPFKKNDGFEQVADRLLDAPQVQEVATIFKDLTSAPLNAYESRVLEGIWAAAPYLHNGSVPSLAELLKPAAERTVSFKIGPAYDINNVGLAAEQTKFNYVLTTTGCNDLNTGNSRCGHEYGTWLSPAEKRALLEYLKSL
jgi:hypothetical protein